MLKAEAEGENRRRIRNGVKQRTEEEALGFIMFIIFLLFFFACLLSCFGLNLCFFSPNPNANYKTVKSNG